MSLENQNKFINLIEENVGWKSVPQEQMDGYPYERKDAFMTGHLILFPKKYIFKRKSLYMYI